MSGLAALFEEASSCMLEMPSLAIPSILAMIALALFLAFWVAVVVCLATAGVPETGTFLSLHHTTDVELSDTKEDKNLSFKRNDGIDYKTFRRIEYHRGEMFQNLLWIYFIGLIWTTEFIFGN